MLQSVAVYLILVCMIDKAYGHAGWVVQVTLPPSTLGLPPAFKFYNVAIVEAAKAVAAVEAEFKHNGPKEIRTDAIRKLSSAEVASIRLTTGGLKPA